jgi:hypothetical protein
MSSAVAELEHLLRSPPPTISLPQQQHRLSNPVALAHAVLEAIREAGDENNLFLRCVIELARPRHPHGSSAPLNSNGVGVVPPGGLEIDPAREELFFHCATGCRQAMLWQWKQHSAEFLGAVRDYFMALGHELGNRTDNGNAFLSPGGDTPASRTCRLACYTSAVALWKRGWDEEGLDEASKSSRRPACPSPREGALVADMHTSLLLARSSASPPRLAGKADLAHYLESLFLHQPEQAATFSQILVGEFSGRSTVSYRLPLEFHKSAHRSFEKSALFPLLQMSMKALSRAVSALEGFDAAAAAGSNHHQEVAVALTRLQEARAVVQLTEDMIGWEFGASAWDPGSMVAVAAAASTMRTLIRPPQEWKPVLVQPDFVRAIFHLHHRLLSQQHQQQHFLVDSKLSLSIDWLAQSLRQLLLQLASLSGSIFSHPSERSQYAFHMTEGTLQLLEQCAQEDVTGKLELMDALQLVSRIVSNFRLTTLVEVPALWALLQGVARLGTQILADQAEECRQAGGDLEGMEHHEWREGVLALLLDCAVLLCGDPWLLYSGTDESRRQARTSLSGVLGPLYEGYVRCRTTMAALEEEYALSEGGDLDEVREAIATTHLEDEIDLVSVVGRLNLSAAIACLSTRLGQIMPSLTSRIDVHGEAQIASMLEESRIIIMYVSQLLTDDNKGEAPTIPDPLVIACHETPALSSEISGALQTLMSFAESQVQRIGSDPSNRMLSPMLAKTFLWFLHRWAPAYVYPTDYGESNSSNPIVREWSSPGQAFETISYCATLCLHYQCYWPQEPQVQRSAGDLLLSLAKRKGSFRSTLVSTSAFKTIVHFHCLTAGVRHSASREEFNSIILSRAGANVLPSMDLLWGYQRLPYLDKARILTAILVGCSETSDSAATAMLSESLKVIHEAFGGYVEAISTNRVGPDDIHAKETACLCIELFCGVANSSEMVDALRIPQFVTPYLSQLANLMKFYADDLTVGESLLRFFRDYTVNFIVTLDREQSLALFQASADVLRNYSTQHCEKRVIRKKSLAEVEAEEEQEYSDILCAIQLLVNLSAKDFIDACNVEQSVNSAHVTDMIFFGLQQILPLMTQGLLQYPALCQSFFELVGFMMDTYPEKVCQLPYDLFSSLLESLLFGMSHYSTAVSNSSLHGIASIAKEHLERQALRNHLMHHPDIFDRISRRLLTDVVFQSVVVDRVEAAGMALLPLIATDVNRFVSVVHDLTAQVPNEEQRRRLQAAFQTLIQPDVLARAASGGYEGRLNRARFKKGFESFVNEVHSFLVLK